MKKLFKNLQDQQSKFELQLNKLYEEFYSSNIIGRLINLEMLSDNFSNDKANDRRIRKLQEQQSEFMNLFEEKIEYLHASINQLNKDLATITQVLEKAGPTNPLTPTPLEYKQTSGYLSTQPLVNQETSGYVQTQPIRNVPRYYVKEKDSNSNLPHVVQVQSESYGELPSNIRTFKDWSTMFYEPLHTPGDNL